MKTSTFKFAMLTVIALVLFTTSSFSNPITRKANTCLKINGIILKAPHKAERGSYKVELLQDNVVIDSSKVSVNKEFEFALSKNSWYTIRITKEGYVPFLVSVDTKLNENNTLIYEFDFETELIDAKSVNTSNAILDFPMGVVKFDAQNNRFYPIEDYTADIKQKIFDPSKSPFFNKDAKDTGKGMMANQDDDDMKVD